MSGHVFPSNSHGYPDERGMELRDMFAARAFEILMRDSVAHVRSTGIMRIDDNDLKSLSASAYAAADAMMVARGR